MSNLVGNVIEWKDLTTAIASAKLPASNTPTWTNFGPANTPQIQQLVFAVGDYAILQPFHVNHDIVPATCQAFIHMHWSTDGTDDGNVQWEFTIVRALGHQQAAFDTVTTITVEAAHMGTQWGHNVTETSSDPITFTEPDELVIVLVRRIAASSDENTDSVFGLTVDWHYQADRDGTLNRSPDFYN